MIHLSPKGLCVVSQLAKSVWRWEVVMTHADDPERYDNLNSPEFKVILRQRHVLGNYQKNDVLGHVKSGLRSSNNTCLKHPTLVNWQQGCSSFLPCP
jgi:hypothetical protein